MNLSKNMQDIFTNEIRFVVRKMRESEDLATKLYFFSAVYGMAFRIMNIEFDPELSFIHYLLNAAYETIHGSLAVLSQGLKPLRIPERLFDRLEEALEELATKIERGEETSSTLQRISNLAYSTTGNGYYLHLKGLLPV